VNSNPHPSFGSAQEGEEKTAGERNATLGREGRGRRKGGFLVSKSWDSEKNGVEERRRTAGKTPPNYSTIGANRVSAESHLAEKEDCNNRIKFANIQSRRETREKERLNRG